MGRIRFGWAQVVLGVALFASAAWLGGPAWILAWPAVAVSVVGAGYLGLGPGVFGKRQDGSIRLLHGLLLLPYHVVAFLRMHWDGWWRAEAPWHRVADGIYLGRRTARVPDDARVHVDLTAELPRIAARSLPVRYYVLPTLDATAPDFEPFACLVEAIAPERAPIFVHCAAGHGRSAAFAAALLVARGLASSAEEAEEILRRARPRVRLHREQRELVDRFARERVTTSAR